LDLPLPTQDAIVTTRIIRLFLKKGIFVNLLLPLLLGKIQIIMMKPPVSWDFGTILGNLAKSSIGNCPRHHLSLGKAPDTFFKW